MCPQRRFIGLPINSIPVGPQPRPPAGEHDTPYELRLSHPAAGYGEAGLTYATHGLLWMLLSITLCIIRIILKAVSASTQIEAADKVGGALELASVGIC